MGHEGKAWRVHRLVWHLTHGPIPEGAKVLHDCYNRICCNPDHLFIGERKAGAKISALNVRWIRTWHRGGYTRAAIAEAFGLCVTSVDSIIGGVKP